MVSSCSAMFSERTNWKLTQNKYTEVLDHVRASGARVVDLTVSNPTQCGFQYDEPTILGAFRNPKALTYEPEATGLPLARAEVTRYYREDYGITVDPDSLLLTTSTSEAYSHVFRLLCNPQDEILVPKPSYPLFDFLGGLQDVTLKPYSLRYAHGWFIDFPSLDHALTPRTRAILLVHPNNPTGSYVHQEERTRLNELCAAQGLALIVDEVFLDYRLGKTPAQSFAASQDCLTFTLSGLSKIAALPQMKVAWVIVTGPQALKNQAVERMEIISDTYLSLNSPTQWAFATLLEQRHSLRPQVLARVKQNWTLLQSAIEKDDCCELLEAEGGWYAVLRVPSTQAKEDLAIEIIRETRTLVHPGHFYDFDTDGYIVVSLITPAKEFQRGVSCVLEFLKNQRT